MAFDPFDNSVDDVEKTHALESYMWELYVLLHHYDPNVVEMMRKLKMKLLRTRQQFGNLVNVTSVSVGVSSCRYENEFNRMLKGEDGNFAFAVRDEGFLRKDGLMASTFV